jgi:Glycosyl transferase family 2
MTKITVVVPTIGRPEYFAQTLQSLALQTATDFDVLVSDNCANPQVDSDQVEKILREINHRVVRQDSRRAFHDHFNRCVNCANGEWIMFVSDDDLISPDYISKCINIINTEPKICVILANQQKIGTNFDPKAIAMAEDFQFEDGHLFLSRWLTAQHPNILTPVSLLARRDQVIANGGFGPYECGAHSDSILLARLCNEGKVAILQGGFYYRVYPDSTGLAMPFASLIRSTSQYERDLSALLASPEWRPVLKTAVRCHHRMIIGRWRRLYIKKASMTELFDQIQLIIHRLLK